MDGTITTGRPADSQGFANGACRVPFEEVLSNCTHMTSKQGTLAISDTHRMELHHICEELNNSVQHLLPCTARNIKMDRLEPD